MPLTAVVARARSKGRRLMVDRLARRPARLRGDRPYVSFTFDDFPRSALLEGGRILEESGVRGTYFVSLGLVGTESPSGPIASIDDLRALAENGHELGCHTFDHLDGRVSTTEEFERSIAANRSAIADAVPGGRFRTFAYPLDGPLVALKRQVGRHFVCCRGGGQTFNRSPLDLNLLKAYFLDHRDGGRLRGVQDVIRRNAEARGWLIFATHDVDPHPSRYGCSPAFLTDVVRLVLDSGAAVLPMGQACDALGLGRAPRWGAGASI